MTKYVFFETDLLTNRNISRWKKGLYRDRALQLKCSFLILLKLRPLSLLKIVVWKLWNFDSLLFFSGCEELRRTFWPWWIFRCTRCRLARLLQFRRFCVQAFPRNLQSDFSTLNFGLSYPRPWTRPFKDNFQHKFKLHWFIVLWLVEKFRAANQNYQNLCKKSL